MGRKTTEGLLIKIFYATFGGCFFWLLLNVVLNVQTTDYGDMTPISIFNPAVIAICTIAFMLILLKFRRYILWNSHLKDEKKAKRFAGAVMLAILALQILCASELRLVTAGQYTTDFGVISDAAQTIARGEVYLGDYFYKLPYQNMTVLLLALAHKAATLVGIESFNAAAIGLNILCIDASIILIFGTVKKFFSTSEACFAILLTAAFLPFYTYVVYFYTDSLSMPFGILTAYLYLLTLNNQNTRILFVKYVGAGLSAFLACSIKGSAAIVLVAIAIHFVLCRIRKLTVTTVIGFSLFVSVFSVLILLFPYFVDATGSFPYRQREAGIIPAVPHYIMMGLHYDRYGAWNQEDYTATFDTYKTKEERAENAWQTVRDRLLNYKLDGYIKFVTRKTTWEWGDGTYFAPAKLSLPHVKDSFLHQIFLTDGKYYSVFTYYSQVYQVTLIFLIFCSIRKRWREGKTNVMFFINLAIFGTYLFFIIWEARSRYLLNFTPFFLISAVDGLGFLADMPRLQFAFSAQCPRQKKGASAKKK